MKKIENHVLEQGFPNLLCPCTPSAFRLTRMFP